MTLPAWCKEKRFLSLLGVAFATVLSYAYLGAPVTDVIEVLRQVVLLIAQP